MPSWQDFQPFIVSGLALGGVYALSGVGLVVLYRATGVVYLAFGAIGAMGALIAWSLTNANTPGWVGWLVCVLFGVMDLLWTSSGGQSRAITLPTDNGGFVIGQVQVTWTQVIGLAAGVAI